MTALLYKNLRVLYRHRMFMIFNAVLPLVSFLIFFFSIGRPLKDLRVGFVTENVKLSCPGYLSCNISDPSTVTCNLLEFMKDKTGLVLSEYPNETSAIQAVKDYKESATIVIPATFSDHIIRANEMFLNGKQANSSIRLYQDWAVIEVGTTIKLQVVSSADRLLQYSKEVCGVGVGSGWWVQTNAVFGSLDVQGHRAMLPSMMVVILFFLALALTSDQLVTERECGTLSRDAALGVPAYIALVAQITTQLIVVFFQLTLSLGMLLVVYPFTFSSFLSVTCLLFLQSVCGMVWGAAFSLAFRTREQVIQMALGMIFPIFLLTGIIWPRIAMPTVLQYIAEILPLTGSSDAVTDLVLKQQTSPGLIAKAIGAPLAWILAVLLISVKLINKINQ